MMMGRITVVRRTERCCTKYEVESCFSFVLVSPIGQYIGSRFYVPQVSKARGSIFGMRSKE